MLKFNIFTGTLDIVRKISNLVPYAGATADVDLGAKNLSTTGTVTASNLNFNTVPFVHLTLTTPQNHGGANGTVQYVNWDGTELHKDSDFTHSTVTNPSIITIATTGTYELKWSIGITQSGVSRTTYMSHYRINGSLIVIRGRHRNYSRGSAYGDSAVGMNTELDLVAGDYIEVGTIVDDADGVYVSDSIPAEAELIMRRVDALGGAKGDTGTPGVPGDMIWKGDWIAGTYSLYQGVNYQGSSYICNKTSTTETPSTFATDWDVLALKGDTGSAGTTLPYIDLSKTTLQNTGGANGTKTYITWEVNNFIDPAFTHSTTVNPSRVTVVSAGRYAIRGSVATTQGGSQRTTEMLYIRVNGTTEYTVGSQNSYSRGSIYGDIIQTRYDWEMNLSAGDYIEFYTLVVETDAVYTINTIAAGCGVIMRKLA